MRIYSYRMYEKEYSTDFPYRVGVGKSEEEAYKNAYGYIYGAIFYSKLGAKLGEWKLVRKYKKKLKKENKGKSFEGVTVYDF